MIPRLLITSLLAAAILAASPAAIAVDIHDIVRIKGFEESELMGIGLVTGLNKTGDSAKSSGRMARPLAELYKSFGYGLESPMELAGVDSVALVYVTCRIPALGAREGDQVDVVVSTIGDATSLNGGVLVQTWLKSSKFGDIYAWAAGEIELDSTNPRKGVIPRGAQMVRDHRNNPLTAGMSTVTLVLNDAYAGYPVASAIANRITQEYALDESTYGEVWARVDDPKNVILHLAPGQRNDPAAVLAQIMTLSLDAGLIAVPARVVINKDAGTIAVTGDVEISPAIISARGLTITRILPEPVPTVLDPVYSTEHNVQVQATNSVRPAQTAQLDDLLAALESLKVPFDDRVSILREMHRMGVLHAELIEN